MGNRGTSIAVHAIRLLYKSVACRSFDESDADPGAYLAKLDDVFVLEVIVLEDYLEDWSWTVIVESASESTGFCRAQREMVRLNANK